MAGGTACLDQLNFECDAGHHLLAMGQEEGVQRRACGKGKDRWRGSVTWCGKPEHTEKCREGVTLKREERLTVVDSWV